MPTFSYAARTLQGELTNGEIDLRSRDDVVGYLRKQKLIPVKVEEKKQGLGQIEIKFGTGIKTKDIVIFTRQFATMINSSEPVTHRHGG
jgi:type IV pilus assembly protein PilC